MLYCIEIITLTGAKKKKEWIKKGEPVAVAATRKFEYLRGIIKYQ